MNDVSDAGMSTPAALSEDISSPPSASVPRTDEDVLVPDNRGIPEAHVYDPSMQAHCATCADAKVPGRLSTQHGV